MNAHQRLIQLMQTEIDMLGELHGLLLCESDLLEVNDVDGLRSVTDQKHRHLEAVDAAGRQRKVVMDNMVGVDTSSYDIEELFANDQRLMVLWEKLSAKARDCRDLNLANGAIIEAVSRHVSQTLSILQGKQPGMSTQAQTYDQSGLARSESLKHTHIQV